MSVMKNNNMWAMKRLRLCLYNLTFGNMSRLLQTSLFYIYPIIYLIGGIHFTLPVSTVIITEPQEFFTTQKNKKLILDHTVLS